MLNGNKPDYSKATPFTHTPIFSDGSLPGPSVSLAKHLQTTYGIPTQCQQVTNFYALLTQDTIQLL